MARLIVEEKHEQQHQDTVNKDLLQMCCAQSTMANQQQLQIYMILKDKMNVQKI